MPDGVSTPSGITNEKHVLYSECTRVSYSLSPDTGLAKIVQEPDGHPIEAAADCAIPVDPVLVTTMQDTPLLTPALPITPLRKMQMQLEADQAWGLLSAEEEHKASSAKQRKKKSYPEGDEGDYISTHVMGPITVFPAYLSPTVKKWHLESPDEKPPWAVRIPMSGIRAWGNFKIFTRDGDECQISVHRIDARAPGHIKFLHYNAMILHSESSYDQFVGISSCRPPSGRVNARLNPIYGQYLIGWNGERGEWEDQVAAVRISNAKGSTIQAELVFRPALFDHADRNIKPCRGINNPKGASSRLASNDSTADSIQRAPKPQARRRRVTDGPQFDSGQGVFMDPLKRRRVTVDPNGSPTLQLQSQGVGRRLFYNPDVRIKFSAAENVRQFPLGDCDVSSLFEKARQFYGAMKIPTGTNWGLSCKIDGMEEARFIGEGCKDEWDILCKDVRALAINDNGPHLLEIQLAGL